ncbi:ATPase_AAA_core domain-containing protein, partial [Haematococcus lacustris]
MRETIQDRINAWFVENRNPETGEYPDFPDADDGGSKGGKGGKGGEEAAPVEEKVTSVFIPAIEAA